jgi:hypothetical protein
MPEAFIGPLAGAPSRRTDIVSARANVRRAVKYATVMPRVEGELREEGQASAGSAFGGVKDIRV